MDIGPKSEITKIIVPVAPIAQYESILCALNVFIIQPPSNLPIINNPIPPNDRSKEAVLLLVSGFDSVM